MPAEMKPFYTITAALLQDELRDRAGRPRFGAGMRSVTRQGILGIRPNIANFLLLY